MSNLTTRVYLIHFCTPYKHARHYLGVAEDVSARLDQHRRGTGARLMAVVQEAGISWVVARTWRGGRRLEHKLKGYHSGVKLCPICQGKITLEEVLAAQPLPSGGRVIGRRQPMIERPVSQPHLDCAWCRTFAGIAAGNGSHGICARHAKDEYARYRAGKDHLV
jgi:predicted GIY-YIG superfamily endonuclease